MKVVENMLLIGLLMGVSPACGSPVASADADNSDQAPVRRCSDAGQRCVYSAGKVGICVMTPQGRLRCASQH